jgi:hypothetical protein
MTLATAVAGTIKGYSVKRSREFREYGHRVILMRTRIAVNQYNWPTCSRADIVEINATDCNELP